MLGFDVVRSDIADDARHHLDISMDPPANQVVEKLRSASLTEGKAKAVFEYLSCYPPTPKFRELQERKFIPARKPRSNELIMVSPKECFLRQGSLWTKLYPDLFILVDFGLDANHFLEKCGVRRDASINDLAKSLTSNPQESYGLVGSRDRFKGMLGEIAKNFQDISSDVQLEMRGELFSWMIRPFPPDRLVTIQHFSRLMRLLSSTIWEHMFNFGSIFVPHLGTIP